MSSPWLYEVHPDQTSYFPQIGDILMVFKKGYQDYIEMVKLRKIYKVKTQDLAWMKKKSLKEEIMTKVSKISFEVRPPTLCVIKLEVLNNDSQNPFPKYFTIKYHNMNDVVDFLVLYQQYVKYNGKNWNNGDRIRSCIDNCWWTGTVMEVNLTGSSFLNTTVRWDHDDTENLSPWNLERLDQAKEETRNGDIVSKEQIKQGNFVPHAAEWNNATRESECIRISEAIDSIIQLEISQSFSKTMELKQYPVHHLDTGYMMNLDLIKSRVENHFYRRIDAIRFDLQHIVKNARELDKSRSKFIRDVTMITHLAERIIIDSSKTKNDVRKMLKELSLIFPWPIQQEMEECKGKEVKTPKEFNDFQSLQLKDSSREMANIGDDKRRGDTILIGPTNKGIPLSKHPNGGAPSKGVEKSSFGDQEMDFGKKELTDPEVIEISKYEEFKGQGSTGRVEPFRLQFLNKKSEEPEEYERVKRLVKEAGPIFLKCKLCDYAMKIIHITETDTNICINIQDRNTDEFFRHERNHYINGRFCRRCHTFTSQNYWNQHKRLKCGAIEVYHAKRRIYSHEGCEPQYKCHDGLYQDLNMGTCDYCKVCRRDDKPLDFQLFFEYSEKFLHNNPEKENDYTGFAVGLLQASHLQHGRLVYNDPEFDIQTHDNSKCQMVAHMNYKAKSGLSLYCCTKPKEV